MRAMRSIKWFAGLTDEDLKTLLSRATHRIVRKWSTIIREGAVGASFYVLLKGAVQVTSNNNPTLRLVLRKS